MTNSPPTRATDFGNGAVKRNVAHGEGGGSRETSEAVRHVHLVGGHELDHHLRLGVVIFREGGAKRPVNEAHHEHFRVAGARLALEEAPREASCGSILFTVIHREGKEVHSFGCVMVADGCGEQHGVALAHDHTSVGLLGEFARLNRHGPTITEVDGLGYYVHFLFGIANRALVNPAGRFPAVGLRPRSRPGAHAVTNSLSSAAFRISGAGRDPSRWRGNA